MNGAPRESQASTLASLLSELGVAAFGELLDAALLRAYSDRGPGRKKRTAELILCRSELFLLSDMLMVSE